MSSSNRPDRVGEAGGTAPANPAAGVDRSVRAGRRRTARAAVPALVLAAALTACAHPAPMTSASAARTAPTSADRAGTAVPATASPSRPAAGHPAPAVTATPHTQATEPPPSVSTRTRAFAPPPAARPASPRRAAAPPRAAPTVQPLARTGRASPAGGTVLHIGGWSRPVVRGGQDAIDRCDAAVLFSGPDPTRANGYTMDTSVIVGHDYCGFGKLAPLPVGTRVTLEEGGFTYAYHVYANYITPGQGGADNGLYWGDLTLQTCVGSDTGFSYLTRDRT